MSSDIKRYGIILRTKNGVNCFSSMEEHYLGEYIKHTDAKALEDRIAEMLEKISYAMSMINTESKEAYLELEEILIKHKG